ncbi:MAG: hypothetical protein BHK79_02540 [Halanaerobium sp. MDAL1]|jgi:hypothetical protein|nr:MAG: hypothetical protein BHK79_02540 [Halanaerobium sp. MDAL1]
MKNCSPSKLILTSFSTRAAADTFLNLGNIDLYSFDYFGDLDLTEFVISSFSLKKQNLDFKTELLFKAIKEFLINNPDKQYNLIYGSDWDHKPELLNELEKIENLKLRGNSAAVISQLNKKETLIDLFQLAKSSGFKTPELFLKAKDLKKIKNKDIKDLIIKPYHSGGGLDLRVINSEKNFDYIFNEKKENFYLQEFIEGESRSCQFAADSTKAEILSFTRELKATNIDQKSENNFKYGGNILIKENEKERKIIRKFINKLTKKYSLQGINGIDYIKNEKGIFFIELNPRFTAAVELLRPIYQEELLNIYFSNQLTTNYLKKYLQQDLAFNIKAIYYAEKDFTVKKDLRDILEEIKKERINKLSSVFDLKIKDLPEIGEHFTAGEPVFTLLFKAENEKNYLEIKDLIFSDFTVYFRKLA